MNLEIGAFATVRPGWICTDINPAAPGVRQMDATKPFPFPDNRFEFIYCEHTIEHMTLTEGRFMLEECYRVLKPKGVLRVVTPSINFLIKMMRGEHPEYVRWSQTAFRPGQPTLPSVVFNLFVREWGHQFIYDEATLLWCFHHAGFGDLEMPDLQESKHPELCNLAFESRMPSGYLRLESMVVEGTKVNAT